LEQGFSELACQKYIQRKLSTYSASLIKKKKRELSEACISVTGNCIFFFWENLFFFLGVMQKMSAVSHDESYRLGFLASLLPLFISIFALDT